jgi:hypothetical protein
MRNSLGVYGEVDTVRIHDTERVKYPTEVEACAHIRNPDAARFVPAPVGPLRIWCCGCKSLRLPEAFHRHRKRPSGYQSFCKTCQKAHRKGKRLKQADAGHWYRSPNVSQTAFLKEKL